MLELTYKMRRELHCEGRGFYNREEEYHKLWGMEESCKKFKTKGRGSRVGKRESNMGYIGAGGGNGK